jgi:hypothetical protein
VVIKGFVENGSNPLLILDCQTKNFFGEYQFGVEFEPSSRSGLAKVLLDQVRNEVRRKRYSICTEQE